MVIQHPFLHRIYDRLYGGASEPEPVVAPALPPVVQVITPDAMAPVRYQLHDGEKYRGGWGSTQLLATDYWTLRARSVQLFKTNLYARGTIRRLVTNVINTGLALEALPDEKILGFEEDALHDWSEDVENRFDLWAYTPSLCDHMGLQSFGALQATAKMHALVSGDVLVVLHQDAITGLPKVRLVDGSRVQSPFGTGPTEPSIPKGHVIRHGVELDAQGRHVAYWIVQSDEQTLERRIQRLPAVGPSGRRVAWLVYGTDKLLEDVRGEPILSLILQSLKEIDRYRDAVQRKAAINAMLAVFIQKEQGTAPGSSALGRGGIKLRDNTSGPSNGTQQDAAERSFNFTQMHPGFVLDELRPGEEPKGFPATGTDEKFGDFEEAIVSAIAWALEIPPEILKLAFSSNYSASQAAIQELRLTLQPWRQTWAESFCVPIYIEWLTSEVLAGRIKADGLLESWRDPTQFDRFAAWTGSDWTGAIKPSIDPQKTALAYTMMVEQGFITRDRATREITGQKYSKNVARLKRENEMLAEANKAIKEAEQTTAPAKLTVVPKDERDEDDKEQAG